MGGTTYNGTPYVGFNYVNSSWGPMCRSPRDIVMVCKELFGQFQNDFNVSRLKFDETKFSLKEGKKIKIGFYYQTEFTESTNCVIKAVLDVKEKLSSLGY